LPGILASLSVSQPDIQTNSNIYKMQFLV
jgi:hypothetical protein